MLRREGKSIIVTSEPHRQDDVVQRMEDDRRQLGEWKQEQAQLEQQLRMLHLRQHDLQVQLALLREQKHYLDALRQEARRRRGERDEPEQS